MAENFVQITQGSGTKLHTVDRTIGANTVHESVFLPGEPYLATYRNPGSTTFVSAATADSHLLQIMAGSSLIVYVHRVRFYQVVAATTSAYVFTQVVRLTTAGTGGTSQGFAAVDSTDAAAGVTGMTLPTVKGTEGAIVDAAVGAFYQTLPTSFVPAPTLIYDFDYRGPRSKALRIPAGTANGVAFKIRAGVAAATLAIIAEVTEATF